MTTGWAGRVAGRRASDSVARMSLTTPESDVRRRTEANVSPTIRKTATLTGRGTMLVVTDLSALGWTPDRGAELPPDCAPARVSRVDRGPVDAC